MRRCEDCGAEMIHKGECRNCFSMDIQPSNANANEIDQEIKQTRNKPPMGNLLEFNLALQEVVRVREYGKRKYPNTTSWRQVPVDELDNAILRHMFNPDTIDEESGRHHTSHMIVNLLFKLQKEMENENSSSNE